MIMEQKTRNRFTMLRQFFRRIRRRCRGLFLLLHSYHNTFKQITVMVSTPALGVGPGVRRSEVLFGCGSISSVNGSLPVGRPVEVFCSYRGATRFPEIHRSYSMARDCPVSHNGYVTCPLNSPGSQANNAATAAGTLRLKVQ